MGIPLLIDYFIPFIIIFLTFYILLKKSKVFGEGNLAKKINVIISLSLSFLIVFYNPLNINWSNLLANIYSRGFILIVFLAFFVLSTMMISSLKGGKPGIGSFVLGFIIALIFAITTGLFIPLYFEINLENYIGPNFVPYLVLAIFLIILIIIYKFLT
ncbi:MAG: hypothetical protein QW641_00980 [Candidatus Aenigmatarchaeota archaeon]